MHLYIKPIGSTIVWQSWAALGDVISYMCNLDLRVCCIVWNNIIIISYFIN